MGFMEKIIGGSDSNQTTSGGSPSTSGTDNYVEVDEDMLGESVTNADAVVQFAEIEDRSSKEEVKDAISDGNRVLFVEVGTVETSGLDVDSVATDLYNFAESHNCQMFQKDDFEFVIVPPNVDISQQKLGG